MLLFLSLTFVRRSTGVGGKLSRVYLCWVARFLTTDFGGRDNIIVCLCCRACAFVKSNDFFPLSIVIATRRNEFANLIWRSTLYTRTTNETRAFSSFDLTEHSRSFAEWVGALKIVDSKCDNTMFTKLVLFLEEAVRVMGLHRGNVMQPCCRG